MLIFRRIPVTPSIPIFERTILKQQMEIYFLFQESWKKGRKNLYFHPYTFDER